MTGTKSHEEQVDQLIGEIQTWANNLPTTRDFLAKFAERHYSSRVIADALVRGWAGEVSQMGVDSRTRSWLELLLQQTLTSEHIAAQKKMSRSADLLAGVVAIISIAELYRAGGFATLSAMACKVLGFIAHGLGIA